VTRFIKSLYIYLFYEVSIRIGIGEDESPGFRTSLGQPENGSLGTLFDHGRTDIWRKLQTIRGGIYNV
jgi:hypothetical protein